jgi:hypothetical protein
MSKILFQMCKQSSCRRKLAQSGHHGRKSTFIPLFSKVRIFNGGGGHGHSHAAAAAPAPAVKKDDGQKKKKKEKGSDNEEDKDKKEDKKKEAEKVRYQRLPISLEPFVVQIPA